MDSKEEIQLTRKAIKGNPTAYGRLIETYQSYLYKVAFLYMKNEEDALDVVGTTILKAYQNIHKLKNPEWFKTWMTKILIRTALDELKKSFTLTIWNMYKLLHIPLVFPLKKNVI